MPGFESRLCGSGFLLAHTLGGSSDGLKCFRSCWLLWGWGFPLVAGADGRVTSRSYKGGLCTSETREMVGGGGISQKTSPTERSPLAHRFITQWVLHTWRVLERPADPVTVDLAVSPSQGSREGRAARTGSSVKVLAAAPCAQCGVGGLWPGVPLSWLAAEREAGGCFSSCDSRRETSGPRSAGQALFHGGRSMLGAPASPHSHE